MIGLRPLAEPTHGSTGGGGEGAQLFMGFLSWILLGLVVGALAKWIMPGKDPGGLFVTIGIGIAGEIGGGWIESQLGRGTVTGFHEVSLGIATGGALLLLFGYRRIKA